MWTERMLLRAARPCGRVIQLNVDCPVGRVPEKFWRGFYVFGPWLIGFVRTHPCGKKKSQGWSTETLDPNHLLLTTK
jgi:hypothetical protein